MQKSVWQALEDFFSQWCCTYGTSWPPDRDPSTGYKGQATENLRFYDEFSEIRGPESTGKGEKRAQ
jgi:hypothetical protein